MTPNSRSHVVAGLWDEDSSQVLRTLRPGPGSAVRTSAISRAVMSAETKFIASRNASLLISAAAWGCTSAALCSSSARERSVANPQRTRRVRGYRLLGAA
jgi:hypothetical protein